MGKEAHIDSAANAYRDGGEEQNEGSAVRLEVADSGAGFEAGAGRRCARSFVNALCDRTVDVDHVESSCRISSTVEKELSTKMRQAHATRQLGSPTRHTHRKILHTSTKLQTLPKPRRQWGTGRTSISARKPAIA
jgi:hypothetical protein